MSFDYDLVEGVPKEVFDQHVKSVAELAKDDDYRPSSKSEIEKVEEMLDVQEGTLAKMEFYVKKASCKKCGNEIGLNDVIRTAIQDAGHSKSAVLHTLVGNKYIVDRPKHVRCSECDEVMEVASSYGTMMYGCSSQLA